MGIQISDHGIIFQKRILPQYYFSFWQFQFSHNSVKAIDLGLVRKVTGPELARNDNAIQPINWRSNFVIMI
ncbi:MAG: hypothetical protein CMJ79_12855 [Planctomycetaceae bacterium]|nr:hypothetical protein [Planctomycetaceae bacterium]MBK96580.1 hypothetical protein [Planctomycetaceae bacterium]